MALSLTAGSKDRICVLWQPPGNTRYKDVFLFGLGNINNHEEKRDRKLLLHKKEIRKLSIHLF